MLRRFLYLLIAITAFNMVNAQATGINDTIKVGAYREADGTLTPYSQLETVTVHGKQTPYWVNYWKEWTRLRNAVYVTFPYAKAAGKVINEINAQLVNVTDDKKRKAIIKSREKDLKREFASKITNLSVYQGKVLMKLINRETGNNCYEILKEYKGGFNATVYQTIAVIFGSNLKQSYDANGSDKAMEQIVIDVEKMYGYKS